MMYIYIYYLISVSSYVYTLYIVLNSCWLYVCNFLLQTVHHFPLFWSNQHHGFDSGQSATRWAAATCTTALPSFRWAEESGGGLPGDKKGCQVCRLDYPMVDFQRWGRRFEIPAPEPKKTITGWWFQIFFFSPLFYLGKITILTNIFQMGGWNHQPESLLLEAFQYSKVPTPKKPKLLPFIIGSVGPHATR